MSVEFGEQGIKAQSGQNRLVILLLTGAVSVVLFLFENATPSIVGGLGGVFLGIVSYYLDSWTISVIWAW